MGQVVTGQSFLIGFWGYQNNEDLLLLLHSIIDQPIGKLLVNQFGKFYFSVSGIDSDSNSDVWADLQPDRLLLGREIFGRVSFYWTELDSVIWFSTRWQWLAQLIPNKTPDLSALYGYSCFSYVPNPLTPIKEIQSIPAGNVILWHREADYILQTKTEGLNLWQQSPQQITDENYAAQELKKLLYRSIESQTIDLQNKKVGVFLSGGLDSSIVAALLVQRGIKVQGYSLDFGEIGEYTFAEQVAQHLGIPLIRVPVTADVVKKNLVQTIKALDLPFGDGVTVPFYLLYQAATKECDVIFNGEGGDQLFAGWTNKPLISAGVYGNDSFTTAYMKTFHRLWGLESRVFQPQIYTQIEKLNATDWIQIALDQQYAISFLHRLRRASLLLKGAQNIHPRITNLAFAHHIKVRSPFCDRDLAKWTFSLAGELFLNGSCEKYILKKVAAEWLPIEIVERRKRGMGVPLTSYFLQSWWGLLGNWLNPGVLATEQIWKQDLAFQIGSGRFSGNIQGRRIGEILWLLVCWQIWKAEVFQTPKTGYNFQHPFWIPNQFWSYLRQWN